MQWLGLIASFIIGRMNNKKAGPSLMSPTAVFEEITFKSRKVVMMVLSALIAVVLLCGGLMMSIIDATSQFDRSGVIAFTATFNTGLVLALVAITSFILIFTRGWPGVREHRANETEKQSSANFSFSRSAPQGSRALGLEQAISALIVDFVKEREIRRTSRPSGIYNEPRGHAKGFEQEQPPVYHS